MANLGPSRPVTVLVSKTYNDTPFSRPRSVTMYIYNKVFHFKPQTRGYDLW